jgi:hypothetical protein
MVIDSCFENLIYIRVICNKLRCLFFTALVLPLSYYTEAQTIPIPEFKPKAPEGQDNATGQQESTAESEPPRPSDYAMKVQLEPHENEFLEEDGWYQVSDFALAISNSSELCPTGQCEFELEGGEMSGEATPGERSLTGKLNIDTGDTTRIMDLSAFWHTVEERQQNGDTIQVIEGTLDASTDPVNPEYESEINGTLTPDGDGFILEAQGVAGSPYDLEVNEQTSSPDNEEPLEQLGEAIEGMT